MTALIPVTATIPPMTDTDTACWCCDSFEPFCGCTYGGHFKCSSCWECCDCPKCERCDEPINGTPSRWCPSCREYVMEQRWQNASEALAEAGAEFGPRLDAECAECGLPVFSECECDA